jgi:hypothetical protein
MDQPADKLAAVPIGPALSLREAARQRLRRALAEATPEQREQAIQIAVRLLVIKAKKKQQQRPSEVP